MKGRKGGQSADSVMAGKGRVIVQSSSRCAISYYCLHCSLCNEHFSPIFSPSKYFFFYSMLLRFFYLVFKLQSLERCVQSDR